jgi:hypothetical protein
LRLLRRWTITLWTVNTCCWYLPTWLLIIPERIDFIIIYSNKRTYTVAGGRL